MQKKKIVVVGSANMDVVISVPRIPGVGETLLARQVQQYSGGKGANQAAAAARLGGDVSMIGCVGNDDDGKEILRQLARHGVQTAGIQQQNGAPTGNAYIYVAENGENNIVVNPGANSLVTGEYLHLHRHIFENAAYCVTQLETPLDSLYQLAALCGRKKIRLVLNPAPAAQLDFSLLRDVYLIAPNETELDRLVAGAGDVPEKARALHGYGFAHVLVTLGAQGCYLYNRHGGRHYPAFTRLAVQDSTAAGDSFIGTFTFCLARGQSLEQAIYVATVAAAITVSRPGAQAALPTWDEVLEADPALAKER